MDYYTCTADNLIQKAQEQDPEAQLHLGLRYLKGNGFEKNQALGKDWVEKSSLHSLPLAHYILGLCYADGMGTSVDLPKALHHFSLSTDFIPAQIQVAFFYYYGDGVEKNDDKTIEWLAKASKLGSLEALHALIACFQDGYTDPYTPEKIKTLCHLQHLHHEARAWTPTHKLFASGTSFVHYPLTQDDFSPDVWILPPCEHYSTLSMEELHTKAEEGDTEAQYEYGRRFYEQHHYEKAYEWMKQAEKYEHAVFALGMMSLFGEGTKQDVSKALQYFQKGDSHHKLEKNKSSQVYTLMEKFKESTPINFHTSPLANASVTYATALLFVSGFLGGKDEARGFAQLKASADLKYVPSYLRLGIMYEEGSGVEQDVPLGNQWFMQSGEENDPTGLHLAGSYLIDGERVPKDVAKGARYILKSARLNESIGLSRLGELYINGIYFEKNLELGEHFLKLSVAQNCTFGRYSYALYLLHKEFSEENIKIAKGYLKQNLEESCKRSAYLLQSLDDDDFSLNKFPLERPWG